MKLLSFELTILRTLNKNVLLERAKRQKISKHFGRTLFHKTYFEKKINNVMPNQNAL